MVAAAEPALIDVDATGSPAPERPEWLRRYMRRSVPIDVAAGALALVVSWLVRRATSPHSVELRIAVIVGVLVILPLWVIALAASGVYERRLVGAGTDEYRKVLNAGLVMFATAASAGFMLQLTAGRILLLWAAPMMTAFTIVARHLHRRRLHRKRALGQHLQRTVLVGPPGELEMVADHLRRQPWAGFHVVGACTSEPFDASRLTEGSPVTTYGTHPDEVRAALAAERADTLIVTDVRALGPSGLRDLTWDLEGSHVQLIVAPAITDIAGPRITSRPVAGLPLLHVEEPRLSLTARIFKAAFDRTIAAFALVLLSPVIALAAAAVKLTSKGPVLYRQTRVGLDGRYFEILKFRTMVQNADALRPTLVAVNDASGPLFKLRNDPRVTPVGRWLRRLSIDELPQLVQVLTGRMSIVGPRPPLPSEVEQYDSHVHRKFLVKPGMTGLWQVSGRSELAWEEAVRLDLYYVDNWSPTMDLVICLRTVTVVFRRRGAY